MIIIRVGVWVVPTLHTNGAALYARAHGPACCALCSGDATQTLYADISRTTEAGCPAFFLSYATGVGWICQFHSSNGTMASEYDTASIAYLPA